MDEIKPLAYEPSIVMECMDKEKLFYLDGLCLASTFYGCRYQNKLSAPVRVEGRLCYACEKHDKRLPVIDDIVDWINKYGNKNEQGL
jgi:hypothetical protein